MSKSHLLDDKEIFESKEEIPEPEPIPPLKSPTVNAPNALSGNFVCKKGIEWDEPLPFYE